MLILGFPDLKLLELCLPKVRRVHDEKMTGACATSLLIPRAISDALALGKRLSQVKRGVPAQQMAQVEMACFGWPKI